MPHVQRGEGAAGAKWVYDLAEVVAWRERTVAEKARAEGGCGDDGEGDPSNPLSGLRGLDLIKAQDALVKLAIKQRYAVNPQAVAAIWVRSFRDIGNACMTIPDLYARDLGGFPEDVVRDWTRATKGTQAGKAPMSVARTSREVAAYVRDLASMKAGGQEELAVALGLDRSHVTRAVTGQRLSEGLLRALNMRFDAGSARYIQTAEPTVAVPDLATAKSEIRRLVEIIGALNDTIRGLRAALKTK